MNQLEKLYLKSMSKVAFTKNTRKAYDLILKQKRQLSSKDIFELEFGDKITEHMNNPEHQKRLIEILPSYRDPDFFRIPGLHKRIFSNYGYAYHADKDKMYINDLCHHYNGGSRLPTIGHEHIHVLQNNRLDDEDYHPYDNNFREEHEKLIQKPFDKFLKKIYSTRLFGGKHTKYLAEDCEIQARLHEFVAEGIQNGAKKIPQSKIELWTALKDSGYPMPKNLARHIDQHKKEHGITEQFNANTYWLSRINERFLISEDNKVAFIHRTLPYIYGHLLELYGDDQGRKKMSFAENTLES